MNHFFYKTGLSQKPLVLSCDYLYAAAAFAVGADADLGVYAFQQFFAVGDDAYTAVALTGDELQFVEGGHDAVEAFLVEGAEAFVDEEAVDIEVGPVKGGEGQREG